MAGDTADVNALDDLYKFGMLVLCAVGMAIYLRLLQNRADWVKMEAVLGLVFAAGVPLARVALCFYLKTDIDQYAILFFQMLMIFMAFQGLVVYLTQNALDPSVPITISISSILLRGGVLLCDLNGLFYVKTMANIPLQIDIVVLTLLLLGNMFHLSKLSTREGHLTIGDPVSWHLSFDAMVTFLIGAFLFGFSKMAIEIMFPGANPQCHHLILCKACGCSLLSGALLSFGALTFKHSEDSLTILKSKFVAHLATTLLGLIHFMTDKSFMSSTFFLFLVLMCVLAFNACLPVWEDERKKKE